VADDFLHDLELLIRSRHPLIFLETVEKDRAQGMLMHVADRMKLPFYSWTRTKGLRPAEQRAADPGTLAPVDALAKLEALYRPALVNFQGLGDDLEDRLTATRLRDAVRQYQTLVGCVVVTGAAPAELPTVLSGLGTVMELPLPSAAEYESLVKRLYRDLSKRYAIELHLTREDLDLLIRNLSGFTLIEAEKVLTLAMVEDGRLDPSDLRRVIDAKRTILERDGLLEFYPVEEGLDDVAGLASLKAWLAKRRAIVRDPVRAAEFGLPFPKGLLLLGVQGAGKSLCAKAVANDWGLPLLRMDPAGLYNKYVGETERNVRRAMAAAEKMAPVVLWIDEIEKAFASGGEMDGGVSQRVLGLFLSWLQERRGDVFVVATANDVSRLPPELIRKGRFDEIFFVDLPDAEVRAEILRLHLRRRGQDPDAIDLGLVARAAEDFSGAELEQVILSALYTAFGEGGRVDQRLLLQEIGATRPLALTMRERVEALRHWARARTVPAH
jgi:SpoVK/Ycf46/Vps4 family AAA+-type ATPase